jgi:hypothetical protein
MASSQFQPFRRLMMDDVVSVWCCSACIKNVLVQCLCGKWFRSDKGKPCSNCELKWCRNCVASLCCGLCGTYKDFCRSCLFDPKKRKQNKAATREDRWTWIDTVSHVFDEKQFSENNVILTVCDRHYQPPCITCEDSSQYTQEPDSGLLRKQCEECQSYFCDEKKFCGLDYSDNRRCRACLLKNSNEFAWRDSGWLIRGSANLIDCCWICSSKYNLKMVAQCSCDNEIPGDDRCEAKYYFLCTAHSTPRRIEVLLQQLFPQCEVCKLWFHCDNRHFTFCTECVARGPCWKCEPKVHWLSPTSDFSESFCKTCCNDRLMAMNQVLNPLFPEVLVQLCLSFYFKSN